VELINVKCNAVWFLIQSVTWHIFCGWWITNWSLLHIYHPTFSIYHPTIIGIFLS